MKKYVSLDKRSKKAQKEYYSKQRLTWGVLNPVTRSVPSGKTYNRKKDRQERRRIGKEFSDGFDADFLSPFIPRDFLVALDEFCLTKTPIRNIFHPNQEKYAIL